MSEPSGAPQRDKRKIFVEAPAGTSKAKPPARAGRAGSPPPPKPSAPRPGPRSRPAGRQPAPKTPKKRRRRRRKASWARKLGLVLLCFALLIVGGLLWANWKFSQIERVEVSSVLGGGSGTNYLMVGSDTRDGISGDDPNAGAFLDGPEQGGQRSDTLLILRIADGGAKMLSVPRDLYVTIAETGQQTRINTAYNGGPERLVKTINDNLGIPIHRYIEVDFVSFAGMVDSLGGITIDFLNPARDPKTGLLVTSAGPQHLDGTQALAFVRSRNYIETIDGTERTDPAGDLGRVVRQQQFLSAVMGEIGSVKNPFKVIGLTNSLVGGLRIDDAMTMWDALGLLRRMRGLDPQPETLPTTPFRTSGGAAVLDLVEAEAEPILEKFR